MPRGRPPLYRRWGESVGAWVLDEAGEALERRQLELPPLASRPDDLNAWAVANPPPRRDDFATQELFDEAREPWYAVLLGTRLPPYGQNAERAKAWDMACMRHSERSLSHDIAQERAVKMAEELAAAAAQEDFPWARECRCSMRWPLGTRLVIKRVEKELGQNSHGVLSWWTVGVCQAKCKSACACAVRAREARLGATCDGVLRAFVDLSSVIPNS